MADESGFEVLSCYCGRYPVVASIPILKKGVVTASGLTAEEVVHLIEAGQYGEALIRLLLPRPPASADLAPSWIQALPAVRGLGRLKSVFGQPALHAWRRQALDFLSHLDNDVTACELFDFYFCDGTRGGRESYNAYAYRFGEPRHLVALSLASLIQTPTKPVLDLACGHGHFTRHLFRWAQDQPVIGLDRTFFALYVAKNWLAPTAHYICADADPGLPFSEGTFSAAVCSDAFHYFPNKPMCIRELKRLTQNEGLIALVTIRNALVDPVYDRTLPPEGYDNLVADMPHRLVANRDIMGRYLQKQGPALAQSTDLGRLVSEPWLSLVASHRQELLRDYGPLEDWPHAEGHLALNPLYQQEGQDGFGNVHLRHTFPSAWYEQENAECRQYEPETLSVSARVLADVAQQNRTIELERLIEQCVVLGMPERFR